MKRPKERVAAPGPAECMACTTMALAGNEAERHHGHHGHSLKRSTWSAMTVSQAREVYPSTRGGGGGVGGAYDKALVPVDPKLKERTFHYLQVCASLHANIFACMSPSVRPLCVIVYLRAYLHLFLRHRKERNKASAYPYVKTIRSRIMEMVQTGIKGSIQLHSKLFQDNISILSSPSHHSVKFEHFPFRITQSWERKSKQMPRDAQDSI